MSAPEKIFVTVEYIGKTDTVVCGVFGTYPMDESVEFTRTDLSQAAVAAALEAAAQWHDAEIDRLEAQIAENNKYLRLAGKSTKSTANDFCDAGIGYHRGSAAHLRALITPSQHDALAAHVAAEVAKARAEIYAQIEAMPRREELLGGQRTEYIQLHEALAWIGAKQ